MKETTRIFKSEEVCKLLIKEMGFEDTEDENNFDVNWRINYPAKENEIEVIYKVSDGREITETQGEQKYPRNETIFEQTIQIPIEDTPQIISNIVKAVNGF